jgi:methyl-accepting chemotaxis protein
MRKKLSLNFRLRLIFSFGMICLIIVAAMSMHSLQSTIDQTEKLANHNLPQALVIGDIRTYSNEGLYLLMQMTLPANDQKEQERLKGKLDSALNHINLSLKKYGEGHLLADEVQLYQKVLNDWSIVEDKIHHVRPLVESQKTEDRIQFSAIYSGEFAKQRHAFYESLDTLLKYQRNDAATRSKAASENGDFNLRMLLMVVISAVLIIGISGYWFSSSLSKTLLNVVRRLTSGSGSVAQAAEKMESLSKALASSSTQQASALQETTASVEELNAMVSKNAEASQHSVKVGERSLQNVENGKKSVDQMISAMNEIRTSTNQIGNQMRESNQRIQDIARFISEIGEKTKIINDIVFQTKLLSFNASVEAARAGEHGKGFAVVAEEVGNLAALSGKASTEISSMLEGSIQKVQQIAHEMIGKVERLIQEGQEKVESGTQVAKSCQEALSSLLNSVQSMSQMSREVADASTEQAKGIDEISRAITELDQATQQNTETSQHTAEGAQNLTKEAALLDQLTLELRATIEGRTGIHQNSHTTVTQHPSPTSAAQKEHDQNQYRPAA